MVNPAELENDGIFIDRGCNHIEYLQKCIAIPTSLRLQH